MLADKQKCLQFPHICGVISAEIAAASNEILCKMLAPLSCCTKLLNKWSAFAEREMKSGMDVGLFSSVEFMQSLVRRRERGKCSGVAH